MRTARAIERRGSSVTFGKNMTAHRVSQMVVCLTMLALVGCASASVRSELASLNSWSKEEVDALERPVSHPNYVVSGETTAWIAAHKDKLKKLGHGVRWNPEKQVYVLAH